MIRQYLYIFVFLLTVIAALAEGRTWTDKEGRQFEGKLESVNERFVHIRRASDNKVFQVDRSLLSGADQKFLGLIELDNEIATFLKKHPSTLESSTNLSKRESLPVMAFYIGKSSKQKFNEHVYKYLMHEKFLARVKNDAVVAIIYEKEPNLDKMIERYDTDFPFYFFLYHGSDVCGGPNFAHDVGGVRDPTIDEFMEKVDWGLGLAMDYKRDVSR